MEDGIKGSEVSADVVARVMAISLTVEDAMKAFEAFADIVPRLVIAFWWTIEDSIKDIEVSISADIVRRVMIVCC